MIFPKGAHSGVDSDSVTGCLRMLNDSSIIHHPSSITILAVKSWRISLLSPARCQDGACVVGASWASGDLRLPDEDVTKARYTSTKTTNGRLMSNWWVQKSTFHFLVCFQTLQCPVLKPFQVSIVGGREPRGTSWSCFFSLEKNRYVTRTCWGERPWNKV